MRGEHSTTIRGYPGRIGRPGRRQFLSCGVLRAICKPPPWLMNPNHLVGTSLYPVVTTLKTVSIPQSSIWLCINIIHEVRVIKVYPFPNLLSSLRPFVQVSSILDSPLKSSGLLSKIYLALSFLDLRCLTHQSMVLVQLILQLWVWEKH